MTKLFGPAVYDASATKESIGALIIKALEKAPKAILILCCDESFEDRQEVSALLQQCAMPVFGGVFPNILCQNEVKDKGCLIIPLLVEIEISIHQHLAAKTNRQLDITLSDSKNQSLMVLVDGLSQNIDFALNQLLEKVGTSISVYGGGAGSLSFQQKPCLFTNEGMLEDAMLVIAIPIECEVAVGHGWDVIAGPFLSTKVEGNRIEQLNFQPAAQLYKRIIETKKNISFNDLPFFDVAKTYPFGIKRLDDDILVRDPVTEENNSLLCVGQVPENTLLYILEGESENLIAAAKASVSQKVPAQSQYVEAMSFDCISRKLFLAENFNTELKSIHSALGQSPMLFGALVFGEIASGKSGGIHFHNKTSVTAVFNQDS